MIRGDVSAGLPTVAAAASCNITSKCHHLLRSWKSLCSISSNSMYKYIASVEAHRQNPTQSTGIDRDKTKQCASVIDNKI